MATNLTEMLLVTANVGSIFEEPVQMLTTWVSELQKTIKKLQPSFVALHCQEIGGKNYAGTMKCVDEFVSTLDGFLSTNNSGDVMLIVFIATFGIDNNTSARLTGIEELLNFDRIRVFLDEDFESSERFTALGNFYFVHESIKTAEIWDFKERVFHPCIGKHVHSGNIEDVSSKEKTKFPPDFFPERKWSRKGYLRTRWNINGTHFDLINIHLLHDASNFLAIEKTPSIYSSFRQRELQHVVDRLKNDDFELLPYIIFGDFNFRLDTQGVVKRLTNKSIPHNVKSNKNGEISKIVYREENNENKIVLTVGKKEFDHHERHDSFFLDRGQWLREFDKELSPFADHFSEFPVHFPPSYPFCEDMNSGTSYMKTRCPAWCDRILLSKSANVLVQEYNDNASIQYDVIGEGVCMGDHKPVYLFFRMPSNSALERVASPKTDRSLCLSGIVSHNQTSPDSTTVTRYIHVRHTGSPVRIFRETTV